MLALQIVLETDCLHRLTCASPGSSGSNVGKVCGIGGSWKFRLHHRRNRRSAPSSRCAATAISRSQSSSRSCALGRRYGSSTTCFKHGDEETDQHIMGSQQKTRDLLAEACCEWDTPVARAGWLEWTGVFMSGLMTYSCILLLPRGLSCPRCRTSRRRGCRTRSCSMRCRCRR